MDDNRGRRIFRRGYVPWRDGRLTDLESRQASGGAALTNPQHGVTPLTFPFSVPEIGQYVCRNNIDAWTVLNTSTRAAVGPVTEPIAIVPPFSDATFDAPETDINVVALCAGYDFWTPRGTVLAAADVLTMDPRGPTGVIVVSTATAPIPDLPRAWTRMYDYFDLFYWQMWATRPSPAGPGSGQTAMTITAGTGGGGTTNTIASAAFVLQGAAAYNAVVAITGLTVGSVNARIMGYTTQGTAFALTATTTYNANGTYTINALAPPQHAIHAYLELDYTNAGAANNTITITDASVFIDMEY